MNDSYSLQKNLAIFTKFRKISNNWSISQKIIYGYTIAISIALIGTISGLIIASDYEKTAQKQLDLAYQQQTLLKDLENSVTRVRLHPQRLVTVLENSIWLEFEKNKFLSEVAQVNQYLSKLEIFINKYPNYLAINYTDFHYFLQKYKINTDLYTQIIKSSWQKIEPDSTQAETTKSFEQKLLILLKEEESVTLNIKLLKEEESVTLNIKFEKNSDELLLIIARAEIQKQQANTSFRNAQKLRIKVIFGSVLLSVFFAGALAIYTSRLIAHPLQVVTNVAQKIIQESNFQLRANVNSKDEVGTLATSLNQLVEWVGDYTQELELARQTLEQRVEERTQELQQAHYNLEQRVEERTQELQEALQNLQATQGQLIQTEKMSSLGQIKGN